MTEIKWIKLTTSMFDDEKIKIIETLPESDSILIIWIKLLTLAGKVNHGGRIYLTSEIPYTDEMLAAIFNRQLTTVRLALNTLEQFKMIEIDDNSVINIVNWEKHQNVEGMERQKELRSLRNKRYYEKKKALDAPQEEIQTPNKTSYETSEKMQQDALDIDIELDIDKERDKEKDIKDIIIMTSEEAEFISVLSKIPNYPLDRKKDLEMFKTLSERYPNLDLVQSIKDWAIYKQDKPLDKKSNVRSQINTSFKNYVTWNKNLKTEGGHQSGGNRQDHQSYDPYADLPSL